MLRKSKRSWLAVLVTLAVGILLLACNPPSDDGPSPGGPSPAKLTKITVTPSTEDIYVPTDLRTQYKAEGAYDDGTKADITAKVSWTSATPAVASIDAAGLATPKAVGSATVTASLDGITSDGVTLNVRPFPKTITVSPSTEDIYVATNLRKLYKAVGTYDDRTPSVDITAKVNWTSTTLDVVGIDAAGIATPKAVGSATVTASFGGITSNEVTLHVHLLPKTITVTPAVAGIYVQAVPTDLRTLYKAEGAYDDGKTFDIMAKVNWTSAAPTIVSIDAAGFATPKAVGSATVTASLGSVTSNEVTLNVLPPKLTGITVTPSTENIYVQASQTVPTTDLGKLYKAEGTYNVGKSPVDITAKVSWKSAAPDVASIDAKGIVTPGLIGSAKVTASLDGVTSNEVTLNVLPFPKTIRVTPAVADIYVPTDLRTVPTDLGTLYKAEGIQDDGNSLGYITAAKVSWTSAAPDVVSIDAAGLATPKAFDSAKVTASFGGITSNEVTLNVLPPKLTGITITPSTKDIYVATDLQTVQANLRTLTAEGTYNVGAKADITRTVSWTSAAPDVLSIDDKGIATPKAATGSAKVTASLDGITSNEVTLNLVPPKLTGITVTPAVTGIYAQTVPTDLRKLYKAEGTYNVGNPGDITANVSWASTTPTVVSVDAAGLATPKAATGSTQVTASLDGIISSGVTLDVRPFPKTITVTPSTKDIYVQADLQTLYKAEGRYDDGKPPVDITAAVSWTSAAPNVVSIDAAGIATPKVVDSTKVTASLGGVTSNEVTLNVVLPVCGRKAGAALSTAAGGGLNDTDKDNAAGACLKIREIVDSNDSKTKWFTGTPSKAFMEALKYIDRNANDNHDDSYAGVAFGKENKGQFALFRQDGVGAAADGTGGQYDRWCKKLGKIHFAGQSNWRRAQAAELRAMFLLNNSQKTSMYDLFGWSVGNGYWSATKNGSKFTAVTLAGGTYRETDDLSPSGAASASCVAEPQP